MAKQTIEDWIHEVCNEPDKGPCTAIALVHMQNGTLEEEILTKKLPDKISADDIAEWADMFEHRARNYAEGIAGAQTFCMQAFHRNASRPTSKKPFVRQGYTEMDGLMTEGPSGKGILSQMMRHNEAMASRYIQKDQAIFEVLARALEMKSRETDSLRRENIENFGLIKELVLALSDRKHDHKLAEISAQQTALIKQEIVKWAPRLLNSVTGREIIPQSVDDTMLVEDMIDAMMKAGDPSKALPALASLNLPAPLLAKFASRFQQGVQAREAERKTRESVDNTVEADGLQ